MSGCYWNGGGKHDAEYNKFSEELVPFMGPCVTKEGELIRAISKIYYDWYNNGFCNNWSGALEYLKKYGGDVISTEEYDFLSKYSQGQNSNGVSPEKILEDVADRVIEYISSKNGVYEDNPIDMLKLNKYDWNHKYDEDEDEEDIYSFK